MEERVLHHYKISFFHYMKISVTVQGVQVCMLKGIVSLFADLILFFFLYRNFLEVAFTIVFSLEIIVNIPERVTNK
jgi:hypothetical protein